MHIPDLGHHIVLSCFHDLEPPQIALGASQCDMTDDVITGHAVEEEEPAVDPVVQAARDAVSEAFKEGRNVARVIKLYSSVATHSL